MAIKLVIEDLDDEKKRGFLNACVQSGMRETRCETCDCYLLTRGDEDVCPPCREKTHQVKEH